MLRRKFVLSSIPPAELVKHEIVRPLPLDVFLKLIDYKSRDRHRSALVVLRRVQLERPFGHGFSNVNSTSFKIDALYA
jgi:hypothetical protein